MKKIIISLSLIVGVAALAIGGTTAFMSDTETSSGNVFAAGQIDLGIDNESYYNGALNPGTSWELDFDLDDLETPRLFFNFLDLKPDDEGEDTISVHVKDNDAWACMSIDLTNRDDNGLTEPESGDGDATGGVDEGELQNEIHFVWWADDGDNVLEVGENVFKGISTLDELDNYQVALADSSGQGILSSGPLIGSQDYYIGKAWCFGALTTNPVQQDGQGKTGSNGPIQRGTGVSCDGTGLNNLTQTDSVKGDISFTAVQARHEETFLCEGGEGPGCNSKPDVMLVLDRSGSISASEMTQLKTAANAFVTALAPAADGSHIGQSSFSTTGTLDQQLTESSTLITAAINALSPGGTTNLFDGITLATAELNGSPRDRSDVTSPDFMVIITDGNPNEPGSDANAETVAAAAADAARAAGIDVYVVGVGSDVDATYLINNIADDPAHYFAAADYAQLSAALTAIANCEEPLTITGTLTVNKTVTNDSGTGTSTVSDFHFFANGIELANGVPLILPAGNYTITETPTSSIYTTTFGGHCNASGTVTIGIGENKTCTIVNDDKAAETIFTENFGTGSTTGTAPVGWLEANGLGGGTTQTNPPGDGLPGDAESPALGRFAKIGAGGWLCRQVNASSFNSMMLKYYWNGDTDAEDNESGVVEYRATGSCVSGSGWNSLASHELDDTNNNVNEGWSSLFGVNLPASLNGDSSFFIRFRNDANQADEYFRVDGVTLSGLPN